MSNTKRAQTQDFSSTVRLDVSGVRAELAVLTCETSSLSGEEKF